MRINKEQTKEVRRLRKEGKKVREIARKFNVCPKTIRYHLTDECRLRVNKQARNYWDKLPKKAKKQIYARRRKYINEYLNKKYRENKVWRERKKKMSRDYQRRKNENTNARTRS